VVWHMQSADGRIAIDVVGRTAEKLDESSSFGSVGDASAFFESGGVGYSVTSTGSRLDGVVLKTESWNVEPLAVEQAHSTYLPTRRCFFLARRADRQILLRKRADSVPFSTAPGRPEGQARPLAALFEPRPGCGGATAADDDVVDIENLDDRACRECIAACSELQVSRNFLRSE
jgi:hypothetical protein